MKNIENKAFSHRFSIIFSVYNAEKYIDEAIASILNQSIGFEKHVQLILVDDGSPDGCGAICDRYGAQYPNNIIVIHKENGGLSDARNTGLRYATGRYVNFCDPDDILSPNTLEDVYRFFDRHDKRVDIVSIPITLFGSSNGPHHLNNKFAKGSRVINVEKEWYYPQLSIATSFVKNEIAKNLHFDSRLATAEDAEQITKLLVDNHYLGVVAEGEYFYRRYGTSLVAEAPKKKAAYADYVRYFSMEVMRYAEEKLGYIPRFVQNTVMCDLQWKLQLPQVPACLNEQEFAEYQELLSRCLSKIDEDVIMRQKHIPFDTRIALLAKKHNGKVGDFLCLSHDDIYYGFDHRVFHSFSNNTLELNFLEVRDDEISISVRQTVLNQGAMPDGFYLLVNKNKVAAEHVTEAEYNKCMGEVVSKRYHCEFRVPKALLTERENLLTFQTVVDGIEIMLRNLVPKSYFPLTKKFRSSYCVQGGLMFRMLESGLAVSVAEKHLVKRQEKAFCNELWNSEQLGAKKAALARMLVRIYRLFCRKEIWIISDRLNKCGDNGEAFFRYLKQIKFKGAKYYYAIAKGAGYDMMKPLGSVVDRNSWRYKLLHLAATNIISSHADEFVINPFGYYSEPYRDILAKQNFIFLQHGVTKDDISGWLNKYQKNIKGFICAAGPEYESILNTPTYYYTEKEAWLTGFARFDRLYRDEKNYITIMPTWRRYLMDSVDQETGVWNESAGFRQSEYFRFYNSLINDARLIAAAKEYGYQICYMPHPNVITKESLFDHHPDVRFFTIDDEYRDVYANSNLVLTDYSSAVFDFAYLRKPVVYAQFDKDEFFSGSHVYTKGYFDYERDGFGEVIYDLDSTVELLIDYMKNGCLLKDEYRRRVDRFFAFDDQNNCQRILDRVLEMK
ncbi:MAG: CDP-glycerol glycerophosphotransferase family protein [Clostridia bacterium]|nr:CDP-glycerol glycerophosphotransferase family protein [Clostridia bacterium]